MTDKSPLPPLFERCDACTEVDDECSTGCKKRRATDAGTAGLVKEWHDYWSNSAPGIKAKEMGDKLCAALEAQAAEIAVLNSRIEAGVRHESELRAALEIAERDNRALRQLLAHIHLHLTNDENFGVEELEADMRNLGCGEWVDTETILIGVRAGMERERLRAESAEREIAILKGRHTLNASQATPELPSTGGRHSAPKPRC